jgi:hypothetical protein
LAELRKLPGAHAISGTVSDFHGWPEPGQDPAAPAAGPPPGKPPASSRSGPSEVARVTGKEPARVAGKELAVPEPGAARPAQPSWGTVLATTVRLWGQRRLRPLWPNRAGGRVTALLALLVLVLVAGGVTLLVNRGAAAPAQHTATSGGKPAAAGGSGAGTLATATTVRRAAAAWVASQVSADAVVACDPAMCTALQAQHIPTGRLLPIQPDQSGPLGSTVVMATASVRGQYGASLDNVYAPVTLAVFGTGPSEISVRVVAPDGGAAYRADFANDLKQRRAFGATLASNPHIHATAAARSQLLGGQVDARLLMNIATLATMYQLDVISFGGLPGHGASAGVPLRAAVIAPAPDGSMTVSAQTMRGFLLAQQPLFHPSVAALVRTASGDTAVRIEFPAPTPLDLLGSRHP